MMVFTRAVTSFIYITLTQSMEGLCFSNAERYVRSVRLLALVTLSLIPRGAIPLRKTQPKTPDSSSVQQLLIPLIPRHIPMTIVREIIIRHAVTPHEMAHLSLVWLANVQFHTPWISQFRLKRFKNAVGHVFGSDVPENFLAHATPPCSFFDYRPLVIAFARPL